MRKLAFWILPLSLLATGMWTWWATRPIPLQAQEAASSLPFTFRVTFGHKDSAPTDWDGSLRVENGRIDVLNGWRLSERDAASLGGWTIRSQPGSSPADDNSPAPVRFVAAGPTGITVYGSGSEQTRFRATLARGNFDFTLAELRAGSALERLEGAVQILPLLPSSKLTADAREEDFPSVAEAADGSVWAVWPSFNGKLDEIRIRRYQNGRWSTFHTMPGIEGDVWKPQAAVDGKGNLWIVWSEQIDGNWDLYARSLSGESWRPRIPLTQTPGADINHHLISDAAGDVHVTWQGFRSDFNIYLRSHRDGKWQAPVAITEAPGNDWEPAVASDGKGKIAVVWDSYRNGDYDIFVRSAENGIWGTETTVSAAPYFEAHSSVAIDAAARVWVAWERGGPHWGKDQGYTIRSKASGTQLGGQREIRVRCFVNGLARQPAGVVSDALPPAERQFLQWPKLAVDRAGRLWLHFRRRLDRRAPGQGANQSRSLWHGYYTRYEGNRWTAPRELPDSQGRISSQSMMAAGASGNMWLAWPTDNRRWWGNSHIPVVNQVYAGFVPAEGPVVEPELVEPTLEPAPALDPGHTDERGDLAAIRSARTRLGGDELRIVRGDLHRHTELSWDGGGTGDSSLLDFYRYMIDAAGMDFGAVTDHNAGGDHLYSYWYIQKTTDMFHLPGRYVSLYGYERSAVFPNGHRNIFHARRGIPVVTFFTRSIMSGERPGVGTGALLENDTKLLYEILRRTQGIAISHTSATRMGTDWRDNDPALEPVVEIFQGARTNYEYLGAPRSVDLQEDAQHMERAGYQPEGFVDNAWKKGYRLGTITSSDHGSTHISYAMVYVKDSSREGVLDGIRQRHTYGATDNIILEFRIGDHFMGEEFEGRGRPRLRIRARGTADVARIDIRRNDENLASLQPGKREVDVTYADSTAATGLNRYYVRVQQSDGQLAWSSPIWVTLK
ncbi:MAG: hypothetical protein ACREUU_14050 [Gammaproteobacteria bacterium]